MMSKQHRSIFSYPGSKARQMKDILPLLPDHDHYVVVFGGSGAEILHKDAYSHLESFNDLDEHIYQFFTALRQHPTALAQKVAKTPGRHEQVYQEALEIRDITRSCVLAERKKAAYLGCNQHPNRPHGQKVRHHGTRYH